MSGHLRFTDRDGKRLLFNELLTAHWMIVQWNWQREPFRPALHGDAAASVIALPSTYARELAGLL